MIVNMAQLSDILDLSPHQIRELMLNPKFPVHSRGSKGIAHLFSTGDVIRFREARIREQAGKKQNNEIKTDGRERERNAKAEMAEFELERQKREWVRVDEVMSKAAEQFGNCRLILLSIPDRVAQKTKDQKIIEVARDAVREAMAEIQIDQKRFVPDDDADAA